jgi:leucyl-tRNA synthetase
MFASPPDQSLEWSDAGVEGASRFLKRLWRTVHEHVSKGRVPAYPGESGNALAPELKAFRHRLHQTIVKVADDYGRRKQFNTAIAAVMELLNACARLDDTSSTLAPDGVAPPHEGASTADAQTLCAVRQEALEAAVLMLYPIVPHISEALIAELCPEKAQSRLSFPEANAGALVRDEIELVLQVDGKLRGHLTVPAEADRPEIEKAALLTEAAQRYLGGKPPRKLIVVPGRLVNIVP